MAKAADMKSPLQAGSIDFENFPAPAVNGWPNSPAGKPAASGLYNRRPLRGSAGLETPLPWKRALPGFKCYFPDALTVIVKPFA